MRDKLQLQRFEFKYIIDESTALAVRDFVSICGRVYLDADLFPVAFAAAAHREAA